MGAVMEMTIKEPRVLIVEDETRLRELLVDVVPDMGFPAMAVRSGEEAIRVLREEGRDILILDLQLPGMGGMELFEKVRGEWPHLQVIVLTGFGDLPAAQRAIHLDVVEFLSKPCHLSTLEQALDRARKRTRIGRERREVKAAEEDRAMTLAEVEHQQIMAALERSGGNKKAAAVALGISRRTLHYRLAEYRDGGRRG